MIEFSAEVIDIRLASRDRWHLLLTETAFTAAAIEGSLHAVSPGGTWIDVPVLGVVEDRGDLWHVVTKPLAAGTPVTGRVFVPGG